MTVTTKKGTSAASADQSEKKVRTRKAAATKASTASDSQHVGAMPSEATQANHSTEAKKPDTETTVPAKESKKASSNVSRSLSPAAQAIRNVRVKKKSENSKSLPKVSSSFMYATGRRKSARAKMWLWVNQDNLPSHFSINGLPVDTYFCDSVSYAKAAFLPFAVAEVDPSTYSFRADVVGGGKSAQSDAVKLALSIALSKFSTAAATLLKGAKFTTYDSRRVQPKNTGLRKARKKEQFSKR